MINTLLIAVVSGRIKQLVIKTGILHKKSIIISMVISLRNLGGLGGGCQNNVGRQGDDDGGDNGWVLSGPTNDIAGGNEDRDEGGLLAGAQSVPSKSEGDLSGGGKEGEGVGGRGGRGKPGGEHCHVWLCGACG